MNATRIKILKLWEILSQDSDETRPLTTIEILDKLKAQGIDCDRRTLYSDIEILNEYGYEVLTIKGQHANSYCVLNRSFEVPELKVLMDAVQAASFITEKKTDFLVEKIAALGGSNRAKLLKENMVVFNTAKHKNEHIFYNVAAIEDAILNKKKVSFRYFDYNHKAERFYRKDGKRYVVNPLATIFRDDNYYLVAYHDNHDNLASYRVDRMSDVAVESEEIKSSHFQNYDMTKHRNQVFSMFTGKLQRISFKANNELIDVVFDKFGEDIELLKSLNDTFLFVADVQVSPMFFGWCASLGNRLKIERPKSVVEQMKEYIGSVAQVYQTE